MKDFINHFRKDSKHLDKKQQDTKTTHSKPHHKHAKPKPALEKNSEVEIATEMINAYRDRYADMDLNVLRNLIELKDITKSQKHAEPEESYKEIQARLGEAESIETLRQERWHNKINCPSCGSRKTHILSNNEKLSHDNFSYCCLDCKLYFNADTGTPIEKGTPPLSIWMLCWYLLGCTDSIQYISSKLSLDIQTVENMIRHMRKLFKAEQPLQHFMSFDEWSLKHGKSYKERIQHEMLKKKELYMGDTIHVPTDTAEYRRQKTRAQAPHDPHPQRPKPRNRNP